MKRFLCTAVGFLIAAQLHAQIFSTADTGGQGTQTLFASWSLSESEGNAGHGGYVQYVGGLTNDLDGFVLVGTSLVRTSQAPGEHQEYGGAGANWRIWRGEVSLSLFNQVTVPLNRSREASTALLDSALVVSHAFGPLTIYVAANTVVPIGKSQQATFTAPGREINMPIGVTLTHGKWAWYGEADIGHAHLIGTGISWSR